MRGRSARSLLVLSADAGATVGGVFVDCAPERLPYGLEFGLDKGDSGGLSRKDAVVEVLFILSEEWL